MKKRERVMYHNRTVYFRVQTGLLDKKADAERVERERVLRLKYYVAGSLTVTTIEDFKAEFGLCCETS